MAKNTQSKPVRIYSDVVLLNALSPSICTGILRRADIRGKAIQPGLRNALECKASSVYEV